MTLTAQTSSAPASSVLRVSLFGPFALMMPDGAEVVISNRRARALLAMLCLSPREALDREYVSKLLWPGRYQAQARASLRQCLLSLDKALAPLVSKVLDTSHGRIAIDPCCLESDLAQLEASLAKPDVANACRWIEAIGSRPLLDQMHLGVPFQNWLTKCRETVDTRLQVAVERALAALDHDGDIAGRDQLARTCQVRTRAPAWLRDSKPRIAILPLKQHDAVGGAFFLADGVVDELTFRLAEVSALALLGRTSVLNVVQGGGTLPAMADALSASHLIEGDVHRFNDGVRVSLRLIDGRSGVEIWSDRYDGTVTDAIGSRAIIGSHFIAGLCGALGIDVMPAPVRRMTTNRDAYALFLQGREMTLRTAGEGVIAKGQNMLENALLLDPDFAECWAALAETHLYVAGFTSATNRVERLQSMAQAARKAISLDPAQGHARAMLGLYEFINQNAVGALDLVYEAHRLAPNDLNVTLRLGIILVYLGRAATALPYIEEVVAGDPVHGRNYAALCATHLCLGNIQEAIAAGKRMADLGFPAFWLALAHVANREYDRAVQIYWDMRLLLGSTFALPAGMTELTDEARDAYFTLTSRGVCSGDPEERARYCGTLDILHQIMPDPYDNTISHPAIWMGHAELVMKIFGEQTTAVNVTGLMVLWADFDPINRTTKHPDFMAFAERMGFVAAWDKYGWPDRMPCDPRRN